MSKPTWSLFAAVVCLAAALTLSIVRTHAQPAVAIDNDDIGGVVTGPRGPEAGVWVIAETRDLPTGFRKIVVTDAAGRYVVPDLPKASYRVWVRGYGLVDSPASQAAPGQTVNLKATAAPDARAAAEYYPASYWYSLLQVPPRSAFPGTADNGIATSVKSQAEWVALMKGNCHVCHSIGTKATREIPSNLGVFDSSIAAWPRRLQSGQNGANMRSRLTVLGDKPGLAMYADWTDRIAAGEVPAAPPRPEGVERNVVVTQWDWGTATSFIHDTISTDKRNPRVNANGLVFSVDQFSERDFNILDPVRHTTTQIASPQLDPTKPFATPQKVTQASAFNGEDAVWAGRSNLHNPMMDHKGRVWMTHAVRGPANPEICKAGSSHPSAKHFPQNTSARQLSIYDPATKKFTLINPCFGTHHLQFAEDANHTLWSGSAEPDANSVYGWVNTKLFDETGDAVAAQGWAPFILDTNGNGRQDPWVEPGQPIDPARDARIEGSVYGIIINPLDGSVWSAPGQYPSKFSTYIPGYIIRMSPGANPPATAVSEVYEPPFDMARGTGAFFPRGIDIDRNGLIWTSLAGSGQLASFDRRKCKVLNGPTATGKHCPEGWTLYDLPTPKLKGTDINAEFVYYNWVDQFDTFGLGRNVPFAIATGSDALMALMPNSGGTFAVFRVPYPLGFSSRGVDGRIDDPGAGWKGKGLWANFGSHVAWHTEGGKGTTSKAVKFQLRPNPLAH